MVGGVQGGGIDGWASTGWRSCAANLRGVVRIALAGLRGAYHFLPAGGRALTSGISSRRRRRVAVSLSAPAPSGDPIDQLDRIVEIFHQVNLALPKSMLGHKELIALGGRLAQISGELLTLIDVLSAPAYYDERTRMGRGDTGVTAVPRSSTVIGSLRECRDGIFAAYTASRAFRAGLGR
jgi:hypothetical protein